MTLIVLVMALASLVIGEKVQAGGGLGWDGVTYAGLVRSLDDLVTNRELTTYYAQRVLPAALMRAALLVLGKPLTNANIILAFEIYGVVLAVGATLLWRRIADQLALSIAARWIGFSALFINFAFSKQDFFIPVLTDLTAFVAGLLLLYFYIRKNRSAVLVVTVLAAFCWPIAALSGGALLLFMHLRGEKIWGSPDRGRLAPFLGRPLVIIAFLIAGLLYLIAVVLTASDVACPALSRGFAAIAVSAPRALQEKLLGPNACGGFASVLTAIPTLLLFGAGVLWLACSGLRPQRLGQELGRIRLLDVFAFALALLLPWIGIKLLANPALPNVSSPLLLLRLSLFQPKGMVLMPLVSLGAYWGPMILLLIMRWGNFLHAAHRLGPGVVLLICFNIPFGIVGEPRFVTLAWPFLVITMVVALDGSPPSRRFGYAFAFISIAFAQFWLPLNYVRWNNNDYIDLLVFPKQLLFMHYGLWMSWTGYVFQGIMLLVCGISFWYSCAPRCSAQKT